MLRFDTKAKRRPPGLMSRGAQLRLVSLVVGLGLVLAAMSHLRTPQGAAALQRLMHGGPPPLAEQNLPPEDLPPPLLTADQLATIQDNTFFRREESPAWFALFAKLQNDDLAGATAVGPLAYAQLTRQPHVYRGRAVRVAGAVRRVERVDAGQNNLGIASLYRLIVQGQGGEVWPTTLYTLTPPDGAPLGEPVNLPIEATGLFFKNWSYRWQDGLGISPVLVASGVEVLVEATPTPAPSTESPPKWMVPTAIALSGAVLLVVWRRSARPQPTNNQPDAPPPDFSHLAEQGNKS